MFVNVFIFVMVIAVGDCVGVKYKLYTPEKGINSPIMITIKDMGNAVFAQRKYKILCHGWVANSSIYWYTRTIEEYLKTKRVNVIAADYGKAVSSTLYLSAVRNVRPVGQNIGQLCIKINAAKKVSFENFHIIGHSLGAHVAGIAGETVLAKTGKKIGRITGLDPASILFRKKATKNQISKDDGIFVDVIHTSTLMAFAIPLGQVDFYPNGGTAHPGCKEKDNDCFHNLAPILFYESILKFNFVSTKCGSYQKYLKKQCSGGDTTLMGERAKMGSTGKYYLSTSPKLGEEFYSIPKN